MYACSGLLPLVHWYHRPCSISQKRYDANTMIIMTEGFSFWRQAPGASPSACINLHFYTCMLCANEGTFLTLHSLIVAAISPHSVLTCSSCFRWSAGRYSTKREPKTSAIASSCKVKLSICRAWNVH